MKIALKIGLVILIFIVVRYIILIYLPSKGVNLMPDNFDSGKKKDLLANIRRNYRSHL